MIARGRASLVARAWSRRDVRTVVGRGHREHGRDGARPRRSPRSWSGR